MQLDRSLLTLLAGAALSTPACSSAALPPAESPTAHTTPADPPPAVTEDPPRPQPDDPVVARAKEIYHQAEEHAHAGRWSEAQALYEEAYYLVPDKHLFAYKVGVAAFNATPQSCQRAEEYLHHFIRHGDPKRHADALEEAKRILAEISIAQCSSTIAATPEEFPEDFPEDFDCPGCGMG